MESLRHRQALSVASTITSMSSDCDGSGYAQSIGDFMTVCATTSTALTTTSSATAVAADEPVDDDIKSEEKSTEETAPDVIWTAPKQALLAQSTTV
jgi:hypothetical protein